MESGAWIIGCGRAETAIGAKTVAVCTAVVPLVTGSWQFKAQHKRAADVAGELSCASAALQQSIMASFMPECICTPAVTLPLRVANNIRDMENFLIAIVTLGLLQNRCQGLACLQARHRWSQMKPLKARVSNKYAVAKSE